MSQRNPAHIDDGDTTDSPWGEDCEGAPWWFDDPILVRGREIATRFMEQNDRTPDLPALAKADVHRFFVYGTLRKNFPNHRLLNGCRFVCRAWTEPNHFLMIETHAYPIVLQHYGDNRAHIYGEVYEVPTSFIPGFDQFESNGFLYNRQVVEVISDLGEALKCWWYVGDPKCVEKSAFPMAPTFHRTKTNEKYYVYTKMGK